MKCCTKCKQEKEFSCFVKAPYGKYGISSVCKICNKKWRESNSDKIKQLNKEYYKSNIKEFKNYQKEYRKANTDKIKKWRKLNTDKIKESNKEYRKLNKDRLKYERHQYYSKNKDKLMKHSSEYYKKRRNSDLLFRFKCNVRILTNQSFKRGNKHFKKQSKTETLLGCTIAELRDHLEKQFKDGMSFDNHGEWHIDHIIPLASANTQEDLERLCHYTNLQPLWAIDNLKKGDKT